MLNQKQVDDFQTQGYLIIEDFCSSRQCQDLIDRIRMVVEENQHSFPNLAFSSGDNEHAQHDYFIQSADKIHFFLEPDALDETGRIQVPLANAINKIGHGLHEKEPLFKKFSYDHRIKTICEQLGFERVGLVQSMYIFKQPEIGDAVSWHQDSTYLHVEEGDVIGFWFALEDATIENGCLLAIQGTPPLKRRMIYENQRSDFIDENDYEWDLDQQIALEVKRGSLVILHGRLPHASGPNHSNKSRHAFALHVVDTAKSYSKENWLQWPNGIPEM